MFIARLIAAKLALLSLFSANALTETGTATGILQNLNSLIQPFFYLVVAVALGAIVWKFYGNKKRN